MFAKVTKRHIFVGCVVDSANLNFQTYKHKEC